MSMLLTEENTFQANSIEPFGGDYVPPDIRTVRSLQILIEQHFRETRDLELYSRSLNITLGRLNTMAKAHLGRTVYELVQDRLHTEAIKLLLHTTLSVKEIAYALGMSDPAYFFRCFKRITGLRPREFRKQQQSLHTPETHKHTTGRETRHIVLNGHFR